MTISVLKNLIVLIDLLCDEPKALAMEALRLSLARSNFTRNPLPPLLVVYGDISTGFASGCVVGSVLRGRFAFQQGQPSNAEVTEPV